MKKNEIVDMIRANLAAKAEYERLVYDEVNDRGNPARVTEDAIKVLETQLRQRLPDSYRALLMVRNGISLFDGDSHILSVEQMTQRWVEAERATKGELFIEFGNRNPFAEGAIAIMIGEDSNAMLLWEPEGSNGGKFVEYDIVEQVDDYKTLFDYIQEDTELVTEMVEEESGGE